MLEKKEQKDRLLETVSRKLEQWRNQRKVRGPIPAEILGAVSSLLKTHAMGRLNKALRINYNTLKKLQDNEKMFRGNNKRPVEQPQERPAAFVEIPMKPASPEQSELPKRMEAIEFETPQGYKARIFTSHNLTERIEGLVKLLWAAGR